MNYSERQEKLSDYILEYGKRWYIENLNNRILEVEGSLLIATPIECSEEDNYDEYENKILKLNSTVKEYEEYLKAMQEKYLTYYIDKGYMKYSRTEVRFERKVDFFIITEKMYKQSVSIRKWRKEQCELTERMMKNLSVNKTVNKLGIAAEPGKKGIEAKYTNPKCYTEDPGIPGESATEGVRNLIVTPFFLIFKFGIIIDVILWAVWIYHLIENRKRVRDEWERQYNKK